MASPSVGVPAGQRLLDEARALVDPALRAAVERLDDANRLVAAYHLGFADADGATADRPRGKGVRGALALLSARAAGADASIGVPAAVACELVHESSLLHDDIIDRDAVRRGAPTAWTTFGVAPALLAGDALLTLAFEVLADARTSAAHAGTSAAHAGTSAADAGTSAADAGISAADAGISAADAGASATHPGASATHPGTSATHAGTSVAVAGAIRELAVATRLVIAGQSADMAFESRPDVGLDEVRAMVADKTGALLSCAASLGAVLVGGPESLAAALRDYGRHLGMAFQLIDDLLGIWGIADRTGKPVRSDLASRKKSLPVVAAMSSGTLAGQRLSEIYGTDGELGDALLIAAADAVEAAGGRAWATAEAHRETREAHAIIARLGIPQPVRADLVALTDLLVGRDR